ncbi:CpaF family protein [Cellulomonas sp. zg-ZUI222]|uniref:CpaF family protein n=1 Tax=Cellulomonas wangleii TaxID=2816956 RepID=A0ABX8D6K7_9CELL|nr:MULTISPECIES: CpaF family protein [Cellulomonas]MBO0899733.1 CpaF family protein [Cellulomonas sp. zg-ZUI22]MBO0920595.1 CpaF family protein [Cellulomonas wangleii]MBO0922987.1 CpaF family protein [Cellulomonas wangleii]QVI61377.1 CpaF family protein [Cellulomonas wangleii]
MSGFSDWDRRSDASPVAAGSAFARSELDEQLVSQFKRMLLDEVDLHELGRLDTGQRRVRLERVVAHLVSTEGVILTTRERNALIRRVVDESIGLGVLEPLLADETVSEIMINGHDTIYVERFGQIERVATTFATEEQLRQTIDRIVSTVNRRVDESSPMVDARLPADERMPRGARVHVVLPPLTLNGPTVTIRLFPRSYGLDELLRRGTLDAASAELLAACVRARANIIVSGGTSSGKTTFLNALSAFIQGRQRIITIEDAAELSLGQEHVVRLETRPANVEGHGQVTIRDLVRNALRMRPDRIIVGEVRGGEALDMLQAMNTGHEGSLATVHANSTVDALIRLETLASMSDVDVPFHALRDQVNNAIDIVVQLLRGADGTRRVVEIGWVASKHREDFEVQPIMRWDPEAQGPTGTPGRFVLHPIPQRLLDRLRIAGEAIGRAAVPPQAVPSVAEPQDVPAAAEAQDEVAAS